MFYSHISLQTIQTRDSLKEEQLRKRNETVVIVPYWWDGEKERYSLFVTGNSSTNLVNSLLATINFQRPDLVDKDLHISDPISFYPPPHDQGTDGA